VAGAPVPLSHWHHSAEDFSVSPLEFYEAVRRELEATRAPVRFEDVEWSEGSFLSAKRRYLRVEFNRYTFDICAAPFGTSFFFSWWLAQRSSNLALLYGVLGLLAVPFSFGFFVTVFDFFWGFIVFLLAFGIAVIALGNALQKGVPAVEDAILAIPIFGPLYDRFLRPVTYFSLDSRIMFEEAVHGTVLKVVEGLLAAKGARALTSQQAKAQSRDVLR
jgi:hypothetical protein